MKMRTSRFVVFALFLATTSCAYSFRAGSFPPAHVKTIAVQPFDNETNRFELAGEVYDELLRNLPRALGVRTAGGDVADAIVRGSITRYDVVAPNYRAAAEGQAAQVLLRQVNITVAVEIVISSKISSSGNPAASSLRGSFWKLQRPKRWAELRPSNCSFRRL